MTWMQTHTGQRFQLDAPTMDQVRLLDIAWSLANLQRFNGHLAADWSVAQHSLAVADRVAILTNNDPKLVLTALLHDAAEAYTGDIITPLKQLIPGFYAVESRINRTLALVFGLIFPFPEVVRQADAEITSTEAEYLSQHPPLSNWHHALAPPLPLSTLRAHEGSDWMTFISEVQKWHELSTATQLTTLSRGNSPTSSTTH